MPYLNNDVNGVNPSNGNNNAQNNSSSNAKFEQMLNDQTARRQSGMSQQQANQAMYKQLNSMTQNGGMAEYIKIHKTLKDWMKMQKDKYKQDKDYWEKQLAQNPDSKDAKKEYDIAQAQLDALDDMEVAEAKRGEAVVKAISSLANGVRDQFNKVIEMNNDNRLAINTRLQGIQSQQGMWYNEADKWSALQLQITNKYGASMVLKETELIKNIKEAVDKGIANNIEQRAMLATLSESIAGTFEAFSNELNRFIRLHQQDNTTLMLGMESSLTTMLNSLFNDTSYLTDVTTTSVSGALAEAMSQMNAWQASEFNFTVQKWLGSLYSVGMSQDAISNIATALGQIYSGNVGAVSESMQNLFAMSASRSGLSYADILTRGANGGDVNKLLQSMVDYLAEIAGDTNNVVRTAHGGVFGMSISDLKSAQNLSAVASRVFEQETGVETMLGQMGSMVNTIGDRLGLSGMLNNLIENVKYSSAANVVGSGLGQAIYQLIDGFTSVVDTAIPFISAAGFGVDLESKVSDLVIGGLGGLGLFGGGLAAIINSLGGNGAGFTLSNSDIWDTTGLYGSGSGFTSIGTGSGKSRRVSIGGGGGSDISGMEVQEAKSGALSAQGYDEGATAAPEKNTDDIYGEIELLHSEIKALLEEINMSLFGGANRKPMLVDINSFPNGIVNNEIGTQSLRVNVTNTEIERIPVGIGIGAEDVFTQSPNPSVG